MFGRKQQRIRDDQRLPGREPAPAWHDNPSSDEWMPETDTIRAVKEETMTEPQTERRNHLDGEPDVGYTEEDLRAQEADALPAPRAADQCPHCRGTGHVLTTNDLLRESIALLGPNGNEVMRIFYANLLEAAPNLAEIFPPDLLTTDETRMQRDKLLGALVAVAQNFDPDNPQSEGMRVLKTHLATFGRSHKAFYRPSEGVSRPATLAEYHAVGIILLNTLHDVAGAAWLPEYDDVWVPTYDRIAKWMIHYQVEAEETVGEWSGRYPRP